MSQFLQRKIDVSITLGQGDFGTAGGQGSNVVNATGLRVLASIARVGGPDYSTADFRIFGLTESVMNAASDLGKPLDRQRVNMIAVNAGDDTNGMSLVFQGLIQDAYQDFSDQGSASLNVFAFGHAMPSILPVIPVSYPGGANIADMVAGIAVQMRLGFVNYGVTGQLKDSYFWGDVRAQLETISHAAGFLYAIDDTKQQLVIWPKGGSVGGQIPLISPETGLIGYPQYTSAGVKIRTIYNPSIPVGGKLNLQTSIRRARGVWYAQYVNHELESETPGGPWFTTIECSRSGLDA